MADEAWVAIAVALFTGLCAILWNTDGKLDWLAGVAAVLATAVFLGICAFNYGVNVAGYAASQAVAKGGYAIQSAASGVIPACQIGGKIQIALVALLVTLGSLPILFIQIRKSRVR